MLHDSKLEPQIVVHNPPSDSEQPANGLEETATSNIELAPQLRIAIMCQIHQLPFTQIEIQTQRPVCEQCLSSINSLDIECQRVKATNRFRQFVDEFRQDNEQLEKLRGLFRASGITDVRRKIKKTLPHMQELVTLQIKRLVQQGNRQIEEQVNKQLERWKFLDDEVIKDPQHLPAMLQYKSLFAEQRARINALKSDIKKRIAEQMRSLVRKYYTEQFGLE